jgi:Leucine-rich repeat (LRR) protein
MTLQVLTPLRSQHWLRRSSDKADYPLHRLSSSCFGEYGQRTFSPITIQAMSTKTILNLWKKNLGQVPSSVWDNVSLEALILADNGLIEVSARLGQLKSLRMLDLGHNQLSTIPETIGEIVGLSDYLYLHDNRLASLPASIGQLRKLRYFNLSENSFSELPKSVCAMSGLIELRVTDNQLTRIPDCIGHLHRLRELHLRNNRLTTLPSAISELSELRQLDLRGNPIQTLPEELARLPRLEKLDLRWVDSLQAPEWFCALEERGCLIYR